MKLARILAWVVTAGFGGGIVAESIYWLYKGLP